MNLYYRNIVSTLYCMAIAWIRMAHNSDPIAFNCKNTCNKSNSRKSQRGVCSCFSRTIACTKLCKCGFGKMGCLNKVSSAAAIVKISDNLDISFDEVIIQQICSVMDYSDYICNSAAILSCKTVVQYWRYVLRSIIIIVYFQKQKHYNQILIAYFVQVFQQFYLFLHISFLEICCGI